MVLGYPWKGHNLYEFQRAKTAARSHGGWVIQRQQYGQRSQSKNRKFGQDEPGSPINQR